MAIPREVKDELKEKVRVLDIVKEYLREQGQEIRDQGEEFRSVCPFEEGSANSSKFRVSREMYYCYSCGATGDIFKWFMEIEAMTFPEAQEEVAKRAGIDLTPYISSGRETEQEKQRRQISEALGLIAAKSKEVAQALPTEERQIGGLDVSSLVEFGEIGLLPTQEEITKILDAAHVSQSIRKAAGISAAGAEFSRRWVFWGKKRETVVAGRLFGRPGPVVGQAGAKSVGWTIGPQGVTPKDKARSPFVVMDDTHYIKLRAAGVSPVTRPVAPASLRNTRGLMRFDSTDDSPVVVIAPEAEARAEVFEHALAALPASPRLRIVEWHGEAEGRTAKELELSLKNDAGTILDWQLERLARLGGFQTPEKLVKSKERVGRIIEAVKDHPLEAKVYQAIVTEMTTPPQGKKRSGPQN